MPWFAVSSRLRYRWHRLETKAVHAAECNPEILMLTNLRLLNHRPLRLLNPFTRGAEYLKPILRHWITSASLITISMLWPLQAKQPLDSQTDTAAKPAFPASMQTFQIPSHGALLNALVYVAAGAGPHPAVVLLHGFPGNERNLDLAQDIRRAGWDVLYFNYRGSWGSPGDFSFSHAIEDTAAATAVGQGRSRPRIASRSWWFTPWGCG